LIQATLDQRIEKAIKADPVLLSLAKATPAEADAYIDTLFASAPNTVAGLKTACRAAFKPLLRVALLYVRERIEALR
jgi:hypothetical protein